MKHSASKIVAAIFISLCIFTSCQPEPDQNILQTQTCKPIKVIYYYDTGIDTAAYIYNNNDQVIRINFASGGYVTLDYAGNKPIKRSEFNSAGQLHTYTEIAYNTDGTIKTINDFFMNLSTPGRAYEFTYNNGKLSYGKRTIPSSGTLYVDEEYFFRYNGDQIDRCLLKLDHNPTPDTLLYIYDNKPNYFYKHDPNSYFTDYFFIGGTPVFFPLVMSKNNVISIIENKVPQPIVYIEDANKNLKDVIFSDTLVARYSHQCK